MVVAVGVKDYRPLAELFLQAVGVQLRLLLTDSRVALRPFRLDQAERLAVVAPQDVIDKAFARVVGHAGDGKFPVLRIGERPARFLQQQIDEVVAGFGFRIVVIVGSRGVLLLGLSDFDPQSLQFVI